MATAALRLLGIAVPCRDDESSARFPITLTPSWPRSVAAIHVFLAAAKGVDGRHKAGHDENAIQRNREML
jgi:hypothetical protein